MAASCSSLRFIITIIAFQLSVTAQQSPNRNVTLPSSIVAENSDDAAAWASPSGEFAFGFRQVAPGAFLLAVWFNRTPEKTLIWSANRNDPVPAGSSVQLSVDGALELVDPRGQQKWRANQTQSGAVAYAAMLDTGNFVLAAATTAILWQSFDFPTDTLLPSQVLSRGGFLISAFSESNNSRGKFKLEMQPDGNLVLFTILFPMDDKVAAYWSSETFGFGFQLVFNTSGSIHVIAANGTLLMYPFGNGVPAGGQFRQQRLTLDYDGVLRHYVYTNSSWSTRAFLPSNLCLVVKEEHTGGGACGFNSICSMGEADGRPSCSCPPRYSPRGGLDGCAPDFEPHRCDREREDAQHFTLTDIYNRDWPVVNYAKFKNVEEEWCRQSCLRDCYCAVAVYGNRDCYMKSLPFFNGREDSGFTGKAFVKVRITNTTTGSKSSNALIVTLSVLLGCSVVLFLVFCLKNKKSSVVVGGSGVVPTGVNMISSFSLKELQEATNGFNEELGRGACSIVYKGTLKVGNGKGKVVAVKKLHKVEEEADIEFIAEVSSISRTNHKNLVQLLGYCNEGQNRILVYEYMTNGSLANLLFQNSPCRPNWYTRVQIGFGIARGLCYLHEECSVPIIHCDIKPQNVLLDECLTPKIADFGIAKLLKPDQTRTMTRIRGTRGYWAPEWFRNTAVTAKVDVYSFGILLLELLCCRKSYIAESEDEAEAVLADWAYDCYVQGDLEVLVEGDEEAKSDMEMFEIFVKTAMWCIQEDPTMRPEMRRVVHMLEGSIQVPDVPNPAPTFIT